MSKNQKTLDNFLSQVVEKPHVFFSSNQKIVDNALQVAKHFYDNVKKVETVPFSPFTELLTEGFDHDQIWEEIASQNEPFLNYATLTIKTLNKRSPVKQDVYSEEESDQSMDLDQVDEEDQDMDQQDEENLSEAEEEDEENLSKAEEEDEEEEEEEQEESDEEIVPSIVDRQETEAPKKMGTSEVDDNFFNLEEFNKWTDKQEELDMMSDRDDQDDGFDFDHDMGEEEDSEEDSEEEYDATDMTYNDFFGPPAEERNFNKKPYKSKPKEIEYEEELKDSSEEEEEEELSPEDEQEGFVRDLFGADESDQEQEEKSAYQKQQERLEQQIEEYEQENIQDKHWTLRGEAAAKARPINSLLEEDLEFEHANKPVPVITQESTNTLEEMIKKHILDNMFDDVERKVDPTLRPFVPSKRVEISDEKSKQSLADMYEDEFVRKSNNTEKMDARDEALEKDHEEISDLFKSLCHKLDALSNFHYTPKAAKPEMNIISNAAAISMEEVTPVNVSDATLLAPEEVYDKKRSDIKSAAEMDQDERKRLRATKKKLKRKEREMKEKEEKVMQKYHPQKMGQRQAKTKAVKELLGQKNVTVIGKDGQKKSTTKAVTSASLF